MTRSPLLPGLALVFASVAAANAADLPQLGTSLTKDVVAAMTREEKVSLVVGAGTRRPGAPAERQGPVVGETAKGVPGAAGTTTPISRLGIPAVVVADGPAGLRIQPKREGDSRTYYCTAFPIATLLASSWDTELVERVGRAMGNETREYGVDILLGPALNVHRNPLGGRNFEYYSEDPLISGRMAAAAVRGIQSEGVGTSVKHYVANDHEWNRNVIDVKLTQRALREIYLRGFETVVREARPWTVMSSYNRVNGVYTSESPELLDGVLRSDWGFDGLVMTDWFGGRDAVAQLEAGNDLLMPGTARQQEALLAALASGELAEDVLDRNVTRILEVVRRTPSFLGTPRSLAPDLRAHAQVAREAAAQGMVLLRNEAATLPLRAPARLALFGNASYAMVTGGTGSGDVNEAYTVSLVEGLRSQGFVVDPSLADAYAAHLAAEEKKLPPPRPFLPRPPLPERPLAAEEIARAAREADLGLFTLGRNSGEFRDRQREGDFELTALEASLIRDLAAAFHAQRKRLVVVLNVGGVIETASWRDAPDAILLAWQPGQEAGHAVADVLTGRVNPSGRLATTFPMRWEDVPSSASFPGKVLEGPDPSARGPFRGDRAAEVEYTDGIEVGYRHFATRGVKTAYPFGFGLSYTRFEYSGLTLSSPEPRESLTATVTVKNVGAVAGREVVQLYLTAPGATLPKPALELRGFTKTKLLQPGEAQTVSFTLGGRDLASYDEASSSWQVEAGSYKVRIGASSEDLRQTATFTKAEAEQIPRSAELAANPVDGSGAYATGLYRNLFAALGHGEKEIDARIERAWKQLFEGDLQTERLYFPAGRNENGPLAYIPDIQHTDVRSEGMSYGMMIAVQLDRKAEFDALWNWSMTYMYQKDPRHPSYGFFSWQMNYDGTVMDELPAPDGEEYYAMALLFAANRWGNGTGIYDYESHAKRLLHDMVHRQPITGPVRKRGRIVTHTVGKEVNEEHGMILFSPDERNTFTDGSYHLPAFYELWARWGPEADRAFWARAARVSRDFFVKAADPKTGLVPNLSQFDGTPLGFRGPGSAEFREDAWRVAMNWAVDWSWWAKDPRQRELSDRLLAFFESQGLESYGDNWKLDGRLVRDRHSPGLVATNGVASLAATNEARARRFAAALWDLDVPSSTVFRYYDGLLYVMSLLHASGRFRIIPPRP